MDTIQNFEYLFAAYAILWVVVFGYFFYITRQLGDLRREVNALREQHTSRDSGLDEASDT
ncbi:MAG: CcmD family protein [Chloroflexi bacterium]|nr:CcmD family protein [Chloroflexota bacterium]